MINSRRWRWFIVILVVWVGVIGLFPWWQAEAATIKLSGDLHVAASYLSPNERWFVFKGRSFGESDYRLYMIDLTIKPYSYEELDIAPLQANDNVQFSASGRFLLVARSLSTFQWELYIYDFEVDETYLVASGQDLIDTRIAPNERHLLLSPGYDSIVYSLPITGGDAIALTPPDFPISSLDHYFFYEPSPDGNHVVMIAQAFTNTLNGYIGYAPITATGTTIWQGAGEHPSTGMLFSSDSSAAYVSTNNFAGGDRLLHFDLTTGISTTILKNGQFISLDRGDNEYAFVRYVGSEGQSHLYRLTRATGQVIPLFTTEDVLQRTVHDAGSRHLAIGTREGNQNNVYGLDYETPTTATLLLTVSEPSPYFNEYAFTPDGTSIIVGEALNINDVKLYRVAPNGKVPPVLLLEGIPIDDSFLPSRDSLAVWGTIQEGETAKLLYIPLNNTPAHTAFEMSSLEALQIRHVLANDQVIVRTEDVTGNRSFYLTDLRPTVGFTKNEVAVAEGELSLLTITLAPSTTFTTTLSLTLTGTAISDVEIDPNPVVIPPNSHLFTITVNGLPDVQIEESEMVTLTLLQTPDIVIESSANVIITVLDRTKRLYTPLIQSGK